MSENVTAIVLKGNLIASRTVMMLSFEQDELVRVDVK